VLMVPNAAVRFRPPPSGLGRQAANAAVPANGSPAVIWLLGVGDRPHPVQVALGRSNESATEMLEGSLRPGQEVIVGMAATPQEHSWFGFSWSP
jgi:hypothetical protein